MNKISAGSLALQSDKKKITDVKNNMMVIQRRGETEAVSVIMKGLASSHVSSSRNIK